MTRELSGTLVLGTLVFAPWCWGCTWPSGIHLFELLLLAAALLWLITSVGDVRKLHPIFLIAIGAILLEGWAMTLNSRSLWAAAGGLFAPLEQPLAGWPGSVERDLSWEAMARVTAIPGATLIAASLGQSRRWRGRFVQTMVFTGVSLVLLGCWQRWTRAGDIFWGQARHLDYFFATYRNVTNAGEYLNLLVPLAMAGTLTAALQRKTPVRKAASIFASMILVAGSLVSGSKIAPVLSTMLALLFLLGQRREVARLSARVRWGPVFILAAVLALALIVQGAGLDVTSNRWHRLFADDRNASLIHRVEMDRACLASLPAAGAFGLGPGTFPVVSPALAAQEGLPGIWLEAHDDYLQTWLEWGPVGALAWSVYFFGALVVLAQGLHRGWWRSEERTLATGLGVALIGIGLMALVDFPLQIASIQLDVAVIAGLGWSSLTWPRAAIPTPEVRRSQTAATGGGARDSLGSRPAAAPPVATAGR